MTPKRARLAIATVAAGIMLAATGCGGGDADSQSAEPEANAAEVNIKTFMFEPDPLTVEAGTTVTFTNADDILHTVVAGKRDKPSGDFDEDLDGPGSTAEITFDEPGTIDYVCDIHQGMDGQVIVE